MDWATGRKAAPDRYAKLLAIIVGIGAFGVLIVVECIDLSDEAVSPKAGKAPTTNVRRVTEIAIVVRRHLA
jgi:hypothetical protein